MAKQQKQKRASGQWDGEFEVAGLLIFAFSVFFGLSLFAPDSAGRFGQLLHVKAREFYGDVAYLLPFPILWLGIHCVIHKRFSFVWTLKSMGWLIFCVSLFPFFHLIASDGSPAGIARTAAQKEGGGLAGYVLAYALLYGFGKSGAYLLIFTFYVVSISFLFTDVVSKILKSLLYGMAVGIANLIQGLKKIRFRLITYRLLFALRRMVNAAGGRLSLFASAWKAKRGRKLSDLKAKESSMAHQDALLLSPALLEDAAVSAAREEISAVNSDSMKTAAMDGLNSGGLPGENGAAKKEKKKSAMLSSLFKKKGKSGSETAQREFPAVSAMKQPLQLPSLDILKYEKAEKDKDRLFAEEQKDRIIETLKSFGIEVELTHISPGPRITRYEVKPNAGVKVREVVNLADDLALHLAAAPIRVEAPIPGKSAIGIEVPNRGRQVVFIKELLENVPVLSQVKSKMFFALGKDIAGDPKTADLTRMPHLLIAGATGSGKSVCINAVLASILFKAFPSEVKLLLIDPKRVELTPYNGIPHLMAPVITDARQASFALELMIKVMEERYELFAHEGVRNIEGYNQKYAQDTLPFIVVIIDELADLMFQSHQDVEKNICRIAQLARATGIHLVVATQRPSVNVITGLIKANIPSRISFAVASQVDSRTILDTVGAEKLLGEGDMLYLPIDDTKSTRIQGAFISDEETKRLIAFWKKQAQPDYDERFLQLPKGKDGGENGDENDIDDELFREAVEIILTGGQASVSILQRKLKIGYARAGRLVDLMERKGIVGPSLGSKPRDILVGMDYFDRQKVKV